MQAPVLASTPNVQGRRKEKNKTLNLATSHIMYPLSQALKRIQARMKNYSEYEALSTQFANAKEGFWAI